jgi:dTDP-4-dehydrorhamnose 3,5-epimerase
LQRPYGHQKAGVGFSASNLVTILDEPMPGLLLMRAFQHRDDRGEFVKTFSTPAFTGLGLDFLPREIVFSVSARHVVRGMHFQVPPDDHNKYVGCSTGAILDVVLDLRKSSPTFGQSAGFRLDAENRHQLMIPRGFAHGFLALEENSLVSYCTDTSHSPSADSGIRWNSFGFDWPVESPILSAKDQQLPKFDEFDSPFA